MGIYYESGVLSSGKIEEIKVRALVNSITQILSIHRYHKKAKTPTIESRAPLITQ